MSNAVWNPPPGRTVLEHIDHMLDKPIEIPAHRQPDFPVDHSRLDWLRYEQGQQRRADQFGVEVSDYIHDLLAAAHSHREIMAGNAERIKSDIEEVLRLEGIAAALQFSDDELAVIVNQMKATT